VQLQHPNSAKIVSEKQNDAPEMRLKEEWFYEKLVRRLMKGFAKPTLGWNR